MVRAGVAGILLAVVLFAAAFAIPRAHAQDGGRPMRGVALIIGNSDYRHLPALANPANDARAMEQLLDRLGFETELSSDRDARRLSRDLEGFLDDAEGADVAVLFYAGHGIEAGGQNFLVPVDADLSALDAAGEKLVPISAYVERLQAAVPVTIVMLDACRDNPFPAGAAVRLDAASPPVEMGEGGLVATRGASRLAKGRRQAQNVGAVIAFAAEPGHVALDGEPGGNSPYTAAVLRHLDTMAGEEFGLVMRMVAEEVYLKTDGRQRPWINESLRRLLHLGAAPDPVEGIEGDILRERRQLLVTISALPDPERRQVEAMAREGGVMMDALYGMLAALGADTPQDPAELERILREQTARLKAMMEGQRLLAATDPEIARLSDLAATALAEGALQAAIALDEEAKARVRQLDPGLDDEETRLREEQARLRERRLEFAAVFALSAERRALSLDYPGAAEDYAEAARRAEQWDRDTARVYRLRQAGALVEHGAMRGDVPALETSVHLLEGLLAEAETEEGAGDFVVTVRTALADALVEYGRRQIGSETLERAVAVYTAALDMADEEARAALTRRLGTAQVALGLRDVGTARLEEAMAMLERAATLHPRETHPLDWAVIQAELGKVQMELRQRDEDKGDFRVAIDHYRAALETFDERATPAAWAMAQLGLGTALRQQGLWMVIGKRPYFDEAVDAYDAALTLCGRESYPVCWAAANHGKAVALYSLGTWETEDDADTYDYYRRSLEAFDDALKEQRLEMSPLEWVETHTSRAEMLQRFADKSADGIHMVYLTEAANGYRRALEVVNPDSLPALWVDINTRLAGVHGKMATRERAVGSKLPHLREDLRYRREALAGIDPATESAKWARQKAGIAASLHGLGKLAEDAALLDEAAAEYREALAIFDGLDDRHAWAHYQISLGGVLEALGRLDRSVEALHEAHEAYEAAGTVSYFRMFRLRRAYLDRHLATIGPALLELGSERLEAAAAVLREQVAGDLRARDPLLWAATQRRLGLTLEALATLANDDDLLVEAAGAHLAALGEWTRERAPDQRVLTLDSTGEILARLAESEDSDERRKQAIAIWRMAAEGTSREDAPLDWARAQRKLAGALHGIGLREDGADTLLLAAGHYLAALSVDDGKTHTDGFADLHQGLGDVLDELERRKGGDAQALAAVASERSRAFAAAAASVDLAWWNNTERRLADQLAGLADTEGAMEMAMDTLWVYDQILEIAVERDGRPDTAFAKANVARGILHALRGDRADTALLAAAAARMREAAFDGAAYPASLAWSQRFLGRVLTQLCSAQTSEARGGGGAAKAGEAVTSCREASDLLGEHGDEAMLAEARAALADAEQTLADMQ